MKVTAKLRKVRGSHWKLRRYAKVLKGKRAEEALDAAGPSLRRIRPRARGRAFMIKKRYSHITVGLEPKGGVE